MANDFFDKYKAKGGEDLAGIAQQTPAPSAPAPRAQEAVTFAETAEERPAADVPEIAFATEIADEADAPAQSMRFSAPAPSGFVAPARSAAPAYTAASAAQRTAARKTIAGVPVSYLIAGAVALLLVIVMFFMLNRGTAIPSMVGWSASEVELWTSEYKITLVAEKEYSDEVASGDVISQNVAVGERLKSGSFLTVVLSAGPDLSVLVPVPDIMSMSMSEVDAWAAENFMSTVRVTTQTSDTVPSGSVISFTINDDTVLTDAVRRDTPFYVVFSKGKPTGEAIEVPNFLTMSLDEVKAFAAENALVLVIEEEFSETVAKGNIIRQDIKAEETVYEGATITIAVSTGEEIIVPNFASLSRSLADAKLGQLGIQYIIEETYSSLDKDALVSQSISAGTLYQEDDILVLTYSLGNSFMVTSFQGQSEADVYTWRDGLNEDGASIKVVISRTANSAAYGTILEQSHLNVKVGIDETIYFVASAGMPIVVPNFVQSAGKDYADIVTKADVILACDALGITPVFVEENKSGRLPGEVWYQSVTAGSEMKQGDIITIKLVPASEASTVTIPSFVGLTVAGAKAESKYSKFSITYQDESGNPIDIIDVLDTDIVKKQSEAAGGKVAEGYPIVLTVKAAEPAVTPDGNDDTVDDSIVDGDTPIVDGDDTTGGDVTA